MKARWLRLLLIGAVVALMPIKTPMAEGTAGERPSRPEGDAVASDAPEAADASQAEDAALQTSQAPQGMRTRRLRGRPTEAVDVRSRARPDYDPRGLKIDRMQLYPSVTLSERYDDNIFASDGNEEDDFITLVSPALALVSDFRRHALDFRASLDKAFYLQNEDENYLDYGVSADGRLDVLRSWNFYGDAAYDKLHEDRGSPDDVNGEEPTEYTQLSGTLGSFYKLSRISLRAEGDATKLDFDDVDTSAGTTINNDDRDRIEVNAGGRVGYEIIRNYEAFVDAIYSTRIYEDPVDDSGVDRDARGFDVQVGSTFRFTGVTRGEASVGYMQRDYDDPALESISGISANVGVTWNVTGLTTIDLDVTRTIEETAQIGASGFIATGVRIAVDHELRRNVILSGQIRYGNNDYDGINRNDHIGQLRIGADYLLNRNFRVGADYQFAIRESNVDGQDYLRNIVMLRGTAQF